MNDPKKWWLISEESVAIISDALARLDESKPIMELDTGLHTTDCVPDDWKEHPTVKAELTVDAWVLRYGYAVAKKHRHDSAWMLGSLLGVDIKDAWGDPVEKEVFEKRLREKILVGSKQS